MVEPALEEREKGIEREEGEEVEFVSTLYSFERVDYGREKCMCACELICVIKLNTSRWVGYGVRASREGEVENTTFGIKFLKCIFYDLVSPQYLH